MRALAKGEPYRGPSCHNCAQYLERLEAFLGIVCCAGSVEFECGECGTELAFKWDAKEVTDEPEAGT